jgi:hypothetical protein
VSTAVLSAERAKVVEDKEGSGGGALLCTAMADRPRRETAARVISPGIGCATGCKRRARLRWSCAREKLSGGAAVTANFAGGSSSPVVPEEEEWASAFIGEGEAGGVTSAFASSATQALAREAP